jgi:hypothetical protein
MKDIESTRVTLHEIKAISPEHSTRDKNSQSSSEDLPLESINSVAVE